MSDMDIARGRVIRIRGAEYIVSGSFGEASCTLRGKFRLGESPEEVLPVINVSLTASIIVNAVYVGYDARWFKSLAELGLAVISLIVTIRLLQVFPFDFSAYGFAWGTLTRWLLGVAIFGVCVAIIVQVAQLARAAKGATGPDAGT